MLKNFWREFSGFGQSKGSRQRGFALHRRVFRPLRGPVPNDSFQDSERDSSGVEEGRVRDALRRRLSLLVSVREEPKTAGRETGRGWGRLKVSSPTPGPVGPRRIGFGRWTRGWARPWGSSDGRLPGPRSLWPYRPTPTSSLSGYRWVPPLCQRSETEAVEPSCSGSVRGGEGRKVPPQCRPRQKGTVTPSKTPVPPGRGRSRHVLHGVSGWGVVRSPGGFVVRSTYALDSRAIERREADRRSSARKTTAVSRRPRDGPETRLRAVVSWRPERGLRSTRDARPRTSTNRRG